MADDAVEAKDCLDGIAVEEAVQLITGRTREQRQQRLSQRSVETRQTPSHPSAAQQFRQCVQPPLIRDVRRRVQRQLTQHP